MKDFLSASEIVNKVSESGVSKTPYESIMDNIRGSIISVLMETPSYKSLAENPEVVAKLTTLVFKANFKRYGNGYIVKHKKPHSNLVDSIESTAERMVMAEATRKDITRAAKVIAHQDEYDFVEVDAIYASIQDKLDEESSLALDSFESNFLPTVTNTVFANKPELALKGAPLRKDLLYLDLILVAAGTNANKDTILEEELEKSYRTLIGMPVTEEHEIEAVKGVFYDSKLVRIKEGKHPGEVKIVETGGKLAVRARAFVWKDRFPREAFLLKTRQSQGLLRYSVELAFEQAKCSVCERTFGKNELYCDHLMLRRTPDGIATRIVLGTCFIGGAYTIRPAEKDAVSIEVTDPAEEKANKTIKSGVINSEEIEQNSSEAQNIEEIPMETAVASASELNNVNDNVDGGTMFQFESVEELMKSEAFQVAMEAKLSELMGEERESFKASLEELEELSGKKDSELLEARNKLAELEQKLRETSSAMASMVEEKRVSDIVSNLVNKGYKFDSEDEIKAFSDRIKDKSDEDVAFIVSLMEKSAVSAKQPDETTTVVASQVATEIALAAEATEEKPLEAAKNKWDAAVDKVTGRVR